MWVIYEVCWLVSEVLSGRDLDQSGFVEDVPDIVEMMVLAFANDFPVLKRLDLFIGHMPGASIWLTGFAIGALTSWAGWEAGKRPTVPVGAAQPA